jgi:tRNA threonylcarbamoyladenosine biosynthesis protein TsaB
MAEWRGRVLAIDSALEIASAAVAAPGALLAARSLAGERSADRLLALLDAALAESRLRLADLAAIAVARGPGSFTGVRIALATALGLHQATGLPLVAASTLELLARQAPETARRVGVAVDALRGEWYAQIFERGPEGIRPFGGPEIRATEGLARLEVDLWIGEARALPALGALGVETLAGGALAPALALAAASGALGEPATQVPAPLYLRPPAAVARREAVDRG